MWMTRARNPVVGVPYSRLTFDRRTRNYRDDKTGRFIPYDTVRDVIDADIDETKVIMLTTARRLRDGDITIGEWRTLMAGHIKSLHLAEMAAAKGGFHCLTKSDYGRVGFYLKGEYKALNNFANDLQADPSIIVDEAKRRMKFEHRVELYAEAGRGTYEGIRTVEDAKAGYRWEENILEPTAHHCKKYPSCPDMTAMGVVQIGTLVRIGKRSCGPKCRCKIKRRKRKARNAKAK